MVEGPDELVRSSISTPEGASPLIGGTKIVELAIDIFGSEGTGLFPSEEEAKFRDQLAQGQADQVLSRIGQLLEEKKAREQQPQPPLVEDIKPA